jgi:membrane associated rhomboid family serine protease
MLYEYALISIVIASGYWGIFFVRRQPNGTPTFGLMQLGTAVLAGLGLLGQRYDDEEWLRVAGAIGLGAGVCLLVVGPLLRGLARRLAGAERLGIAMRLLDIAEILAPGSGIADEKAVLGAMKEIRDGNIDETVKALTAAKEGGPPLRAAPGPVPAEARLAIDERIALLYLAAYRWEDAIKHAEEHLFGAIPPTSTQAQPASLRAALGVLPAVWVELLGAYARTGNLDQAARMMARLEDVCDGRDDAAVWIHRARMMFLALAGRPAAVQALVDPRRARHMTVAARAYWVAVAHEKHGDREAASAAYAKARTKSRGRPRVLIDEALQRLAQLDAAPPVELSPIASEVVARIEAAPPPAPVRVDRAHVPWATWTLTTILLGAAAAAALAIGTTSDPDGLVRSGAMVRSMVDGGEWWRLVSCIFVHVGAIHLAVNAIGMFFLGRVTEELFGAARTVALFAVSGLAGAFASYLASPAGVSAGASGAIFGLLGAVFIELTWHRQKYRAAWKKGMWGGLVVVTLAQLGIGFLYPAIDQWAHGAGLVAGIVTGALLTPSARWATAAKHAGRTLAAAFAAVSLVAGIQVVRTSIADSLASAAPHRFVLNDVAITAPSTWLDDGELVDPGGLVIVTAYREPLQSLAPQMIATIARAQAIGLKRGFEEVGVPPDRAVALPDGWEGAERVGTIEDALGVTQHYRIVVAGKPVGGELLVVVITTPDGIARAAPEFFRALIASAGPS